ncbi:MAG TPA: Gldg family protein [Candidatus Bathyarchaeia archaeon]|nr:Gldg family protein [Candidatus Bathyarchaeia archaeon]
MKRKTILTLARKEFFDYLNSVAAYVIIIPFLVLSSFLYIRTAFISGIANLRPFFELLPWFLILVAPAIAMRTISKEKQEKTFELLISHPISEIELVIGKFLGSLMFFGGVLLTTLLLPGTLFLFSSPDPGMIFSQYLGAFLVGALFLSIGIAASSLVESAAASFLLGASFSFLMILSGLEIVTISLPSPLSQIANEIAVLPHMGNIARGFLDLRDLLYFLTGTFLFLSIAVAKLSERRTEEKKSEKRKLYFGMSLIVAIGILLNLLMLVYPLRIDLTQGKQYSLSPGTKKLVSQLSDILKIKIFASRDLPGSVQPILKNLEDMLKDYQRYGKQIKVEKVYPDTDQEARNEALSLGIEEVAFNRISSGRFEVQNGFLGLVLRFGDKTETIPFIEDTSDLEYQVSRRINKLTAEKEKAVGFYSPQPLASSQILQDELKVQYQIKNVSLDKEDDQFDLLLAIGGPGEDATAAANITRYLDEGGKAVFLVDKVNVNVQLGTANEVSTGLESILEKYGLKLNSDLIFDSRLGEIITLSQGSTQYLASYPFWFRALPADKQFSPLANLESVLLAWPSSIALEEKEAIEYIKILQTSSSGGRQESNFSINPEQLNLLPDPSGEPILLGVAANHKEKGNRIVIIGDSDFVSDQFIRQSPENFSFVSNLVDWAMADPLLASIPSKSFGRAVFQFTNPLQPMLIQYLSIFLPPICVSLFGFFWLSRRKRLAKRVFKLKDL